MLYVPRVNMYELNDKFIIRFYVPDVNMDGVQVTTSGNKLIVSWNREDFQYEEMNPYYTEFKLNRFLRTFFIPEGVNRSLIFAQEGENGTFAIHMPKSNKLNDSSRVEIKRLTKND